MKTMMAITNAHLVGGKGTLLLEGDRIAAVGGDIPAGAEIIDAKGARIADDIGRKMTPIRMVQARLCIEPALAKEAAIHASSGAIERMRQAVFASREATTWPEYEKQDGFFHRSVAEASDNILLLQLFDQFNEVRKVVVGDTVVRDTSRPTETHKSFVEHDNILAAVERRDPQGAYDEMKKHIGSVASRLFGEL